MVLNGYNGLINSDEQWFEAYFKLGLRHGWGSMDGGWLEG